MKVLYGSPLPPGMEAPTRGELRIRIEKLILKDDLISTTETSSGGSRPYNIPVGHCAVSPIFFGEHQPSCQCVPTTPTQRRSVAQMVYPLKTFDRQFAEYLAQMSASVHGGVQIAIFVPTSYSGRGRVIPVGKSIVSLDTLKPLSPISGWFTIVSDGTTRTSENAGDVSTVLLEVGKIKLTFTITFFSRAPPSPPIRAPVASSSCKSEAMWSAEAPATTAITQPATLYRGTLELENTIDGPSLALLDKKTEIEPAIDNFKKLQQQQQQEQRRSHISGGGGGGVTGPVGSGFMNALPSQIHVSSLSVQDPSQSAIPFISAVETTKESHQRSAISQLLLHGINLREKMTKAVSTTAKLDEFGDSAELLHSRLTPPSRFVSPPGYIPPPSGAEHLHGGPPAIPHESLETSVTSLSDDSGDSDDNDDNDVAEDKLQKGSHEHNSRGGVFQTERRPFCVPFHPDTLYEDAYVEIDLYRIAFSSGPATLGMQEMRIGVRLSKDVKTDEPIESYSSYVHRVPLARGADHHIVLGFHVRAFSEDKSRMVVSFYRVRSEPESNPPGERLLPPNATAQRVLVEETLLGMCIVGLHPQSRDILLHDPITGEDPTQAHLVVRIRNSDGGNANSGPSGAVYLENNRGLVLPAGAETLGKGSNFAAGTADFEQDEKDRKAAAHLRKYLAPTGGVLASTDHSSVPRDSRKLRSRNKERRKRCGGSDGGVPARALGSPSSTTTSSSSSVSSSSRTTFPSRLGRAKKEEPIHSSRDRDLRPQNPSMDALPNGAGESYPVEIVQPHVGGSALRMNGNDAVGCAVVDNNPTMTAINGQRLPGEALLSGENRFRMHVCIRAGKEFPMVSMNKEGSMRLPRITVLDQIENGVRSAITVNGAAVLVDSENRIFRPPTTFFVVEDIFSGADLRVSATGAVPDWFVEAAVLGECDRTQIVPHSQSPKYEYEAVLSLPREGVFLRQAAAEGASPTQNVTACLREMRLTLWHLEEDGSDSSAAGVSTEADFWAKTAMLGECRIDLRSLRFLKVLDGWYRVNAIDRVEEVVGYVRVSVRLL